MKKLLYIVVLLLSCAGFAQQTPPIYIVQGDTLTNPYVDLNEVMVLPELKFDSYKDYLIYNRLKRRTLKVYPYAKMAAERLVVLNERLSKIKRKRDKKRYTKRIERYLEQEFEAELRKLSRSEGRILIKLIHRETGKTTHELIKNLRSGWRAFLYQTTAKFFDLDLKKTYNPVDVEEDAFIEEILLRNNIDNSIAQPQKKSK